MGDQLEYSVSVTPADGSDISPAPCGALLVGAAGNVKVTYANGKEDTVYLAAGVWHKMHVKRVHSTSTTATGIHAGYLV